MSLLRGSRSLLVAALVTLAISAVPDRALAHTYQTAHYNAACSSAPDPNWDIRAYKVRPDVNHPVGPFKSARAEILYSSALYPCNPPAFGDRGYSLIKRSEPPGNGRIRSDRHRKVELLFIRLRVRLDKRPN
jgi:hypothetical protein